jgi:hypothetical protein
LRCPPDAHVLEYDFSFFFFFFLFAALFPC